MQAGISLRLTNRKLKRQHAKGTSKLGVPRLAGVVLCACLRLEAVLHADIVSCVQDFENLEHFTRWPLLPTVDGIASLTPLQSSTLVREIEVESAPELAVAALGKLGIRWASSQHEPHTCLCSHLQC